MPMSVMYGRIRGSTSSSGLEGGRGRKSERESVCMCVCMCEHVWVKAFTSWLTHAEYKLRHDAMIATLAHALEEKIELDSVTSAEAIVALVGDREGGR